MTQHPNYQSPVAWRDPINGDTERLAEDAAAWMAMMTQAIRKPAERKDVGR